MKKLIVTTLFSTVLVGCYTAPPRVYPVAPPQAVVYVQPYYPPPGPTYYWAYHPHYGYGYYSSHHGWYHR